MNLARGFFRIWIVASCLWIAGATTVVWKDVFPSQKTWTIKFEKIGIVKICARNNVQIDELSTWINEQDWEKLNKNIDEKCVQYGSMPSIRDYFYAAFVVFFPPIFTFLLGSALFWISRGFRAT